MLGTSLCYTAINQRQHLKLQLPGDAGSSGTADTQACLYAQQTDPGLCSLALLGWFRHVVIPGDCGKHDNINLRF
jgi:hypothetical protein